MVDLNDRKQLLARSDDMLPVQGAVDVNIPIADLWEAFRHANWWPRWNRCFFWVSNTDLVLGKQLVWAFEPIRWWYFYKMFAIAKIVELVPGSKVTWEVTALPGFYARHTYHLEDLGNGHTRFGSWEQAMGWSFRLTRWFWIPHFRFVKDRSLDGARYLEHVYRAHRKISPDVLKPKRYWPFLLVVLLLLGAALGLGWFYRTFVQLTETEMAPGVIALFGGGGNSMVIKSGSDVLLVDTKFPPVSGWMRSWIVRHEGIPKTIVNTHYHYDHTQGNTEYPEAAIYAQRQVPALMRMRDPMWWNEAESGIPKNLVADTAVLRVGDWDVRLTFPGEAAHTHGDLWVYVRAGKEEVIATGDLVFNGYYPFMDPTDGGVDIQGVIQTAHNLARDYPNARFLPGHGPAATAEDLNRFADYLQELWDAVARARSNGMTEDQAASAIDLSKWHLARLLSPRQGVCWATAKNNIRSVYRIQAGTSDPRNVPCSVWR